MLCKKKRILLLKLFVCADSRLKRSDALRYFLSVNAIFIPNFYYPFNSFISCMREPRRFSVSSQSLGKRVYSEFVFIC